MATVPQWFAPQLQTMSTATFAQFPCQIVDSPYKRECAYCGNTNKDSKGNCESCGASKNKERN